MAPQGTPRWDPAAPDRSRTRPPKSNAPNLAKMPKSFVIHLPHYLDDAGNLPTALPGPAATIALFCGPVVAWVSSGGGDLTNVVCRRSRSRPPCWGEVYARLGLDDRIEWRCRACGESGVISGWRRTMRGHLPLDLWQETRPWRR